jgi:hypothetical protein
VRISVTENDFFVHILQLTADNKTMKTQKWARDRHTKLLLGCRLCPKLRNGKYDKRKKK